MRARRRTAATGRGRGALEQRIGLGIVRFQEASYAFDDVAAAILALPRQDLPVMTSLLFAGPASAESLSAALHLPRPSVSTTLERLKLAGYAQPQPGAPSRIELTAHARAWIERIWAPLREDAARLLDAFTTAQLAMVDRFVEQATAMQDARTTRMRAWLALPASPARRSHRRGGLSPAALQRVTVFIDANLGAAIRLRDLAARAGLSPYHFARAFKTSAGVTPRTFVEGRRIERATQMLADTDRPIAAIAVETGFGTQSRLTSTFRRRTGFTPAVFRRGRR
jgi:AraC family transcriptional regulator